MKKNAYIIDDSKEDYKKIVTDLKSTNFKEIKDNESSELVETIRDYYSDTDNEENQSNCKNEINKILNNLPDIELFIIDYQLFQGNDKINGENFYNDFIKNNLKFRHSIILFITGITGEDSNSIRNKLDILGYNSNSKHRIVFISKSNDSDFEDQLITKLEYAENLKSKSKTVVILTAIQEEFSAVRNHLINLEDISIKDRIYNKGFFHYENIHCDVYFRECGQNNQNASEETTFTINNINPDYIFFCGIAGSAKQKNFDLGDVIIPEKIYYYEGGRVLQDAFKARPESGKNSLKIFEIGKNERSKDEWKKFLKMIHPRDIKADIGKIASGEKLVESIDSYLGEILDDNFNDFSVIEMEGFGFANAMSKQGEGNIGYGVVRGISDIIKQKSEEINNNVENRPLLNKQLASDSAAAFTFWIIFKLLSNP